ncbi:perilipin-3-like isoform X1 [Mauremys reevesii]|uniref:perilipin-3-like isoform X1 n=1 Tax=Mauremys reevesii TaxID=260615 RepID=UPI00193FFE5F|nr:perilipin-3-like isoform X1 [Mauremys reevesii]XP_039401205.1 perilipin-3-like isoform X1 [Mauremys reevesii]XP_039401206.1 perilipin-3-like isoform X1 [Mauremys reevesii]
MASNGKDTTMASPEHGEEEQQNVLRRVASLPLVNSAYDLAATAYASTKESHPYVRSICDMAEKGVTSITNAAVSSAQPVVTKLEPEAELAESVEGAEVASAQPQEHRSYFVRLGSLSTKLRQRAYHYSLNKMRHTSQSIREALSQLHQTMGLIEYLKQGVSLQEVQEKFHHIWLSWNKEQPKSSEMKDLAKPEMESQTPAMSRSIIQQLQDACQLLVSKIQGLPTNFQEKVKQVYRNIEELHASFSTAHSFQDLSSSLLTQSQEMVTKAQEHVDELMAYVMENTPLSWVVGPFIPSGKLSADSLEPQNQENEAEEASKSKEDL